jgi:F0F1-type ATP synthase assembly protein I
MASPNDPPAAAKYRADQLAAEAEAAVKRIGDAPGVPPPPAIPEFLQQDSSASNRGGRGGRSSKFSVKDNKEAIRLWSLGLNFVGGVAGGLLIGYLIDRWQGTNPWGVLIGAAVGLIGGMWGLLREAFRPVK